MITARLKTIFGLSIPLFIMHGIEEIMTGFYAVDAWDQFLFTPFATLTPHGVMFVTFQVMLWLTLVIGFLMLQSERVRLYLLGVAGLVYLFEVHHIVKAVLVGGYYPGLVTAFVFIPLAFVFWREWVRNYTLVGKL